jgi:hypothetical protein
MSFFDKAKDAFEDIKDKVTGEGDGASATIDDAAERAKDRVDGSIDSAADAAKQRADTAADQAAGESASFLDQAGDTAARGIDSTGDWADSATGGRFSEQIDSVENTAEGFVDEDGSAGTRES